MEGSRRCSYCKTECAYCPFFLPAAKDERVVDESRPDGFAVASLACAIGGFVLVGPLGFLCAIIFGAIALGRIDRTGRRGQGLATAGLVIGIVGLAAFTLLLIYLGGL